MAGRVERRLRPAATPGYWRQHVHKESARNTGSPKAWSIDDQPEAREGQAGRPGVAERFVVPLKPGNAGGRDELFGKSVLVIYGDLHDLEGRRLVAGFELLRLQAPCRQQAFPILRLRFDSSCAPQGLKEQEWRCA